MTELTRIGTLHQVAPGRYRVECEGMPEHQRTMFLDAWQVRTAKVGDRVELEYRSTASWGAWVVTQILDSSAEHTAAEECLAVASYIRRVADERKAASCDPELVDTLRQLASEIADGEHWSH